MNKEKAVSTFSLTKKYKDITAVNNLDLTVYDGEVFSLLGVNGAGKTTTIKMLCCLCAPTSGDAEVYSNSIISSPKEVKKLINVSPQQTAVAQNLTAEENLSLICDIYGLKNKKQRIDESICDFDLADVRKKRAGKLSGGYQRRLSIAMALISEPKLVFLDEPTLGLDVIARRELWKHIVKLKGKTTVVLTTHYLEEAQALSDRIGIMKKGSLAAVGTPEELIARSGKTNFEDAFIDLSTEEI